MVDSSWQFWTPSLILACTSILSQVKSTLLQAFRRLWSVNLSHGAIYCQLKVWGWSCHRHQDRSLKVISWTSPLISKAYTRIIFEKRDSRSKFIYNRNTESLYKSQLSGNFFIFVSIVYDLSNSSKVEKYLNDHCDTHAGDDIFQICIRLLILMDSWDAETKPLNFFWSYCYFLLKKKMKY